MIVRKVQRRHRRQRAELERHGTVQPVRREVQLPGHASRRDTQPRSGDVTGPRGPVQCSACALP